MASPVNIFPGAANRIVIGGSPVVAIFGGAQAGYIVNPSTAADQGIAVVENIFVDLVNPAALAESATTVPIVPGQSFSLPPNTTGNVSVNAKTSGHRFSCIIVQPTNPPTPTPTPGPFPPSGPTTQTAVIPSYLYQEYADDDNLQAFVAAYNQLAQQYITTFNDLNLPIYTSSPVSGPLLDWVAEGLYGMMRPTLLSGTSNFIGPFNTYDLNSFAFNASNAIGPSNLAVTSDDIFRRIMTWNFFKGDGNVMNIRWLKRRIMRFLTGANGTNPPINQTYGISVTLGSSLVTITLTNLGPNTTVFQGAIEGGALQFPFQFTPTVTIVN